MTLARRAAGGALWSFGATVAERALGFAVFAVILRFVRPADVGLVALGSALTDLANLVAAGGVCWCSRWLPARPAAGARFGTTWAEMREALRFAGPLVRLAFGSR
ncbi:MAG TPA: hypothetical protein VMU82_03960 [Acetobacteraceae bacterium]|nr:hypothetical protein [Acetobacteraceae bacterium]